MTECFHNLLKIIFIYVVSISMWLWTTPMHFSWILDSCVNECIVFKSVMGCGGLCVYWEICCRSVYIWYLGGTSQTFSLCSLITVYHHCSSLNWVKGRCLIWQHLIRKLRNYLYNKFILLPNVGMLCCVRLYLAPLPSNALKFDAYMVRNVNTSLLDSTCLSLNSF